MGGSGREMVKSNYTYEGGRSGSRSTNERHAALSIAVLLILLICSVRYLQCAKEVMLLSARSSTRSDWIVRAGLARCGSGWNSNEETGWSSARIAWPANLTRL